MQEITTDEVLQKVAAGKPYTLLVLINGLPLPNDEAAVKQMQLQHLTHLFVLEQKGETSVFGPISNDKTFGGLIIFNTTDKERIKNLMKDDPFIKGGHFKYELYDFFSIPGQQLAG
ncbi:MAG TPA: YciI family protein [Chitinophagaceae bacterium]|jgi:uncharacterized protein YciI|nr:YciI family protein [Chitinophagaceae bacterium]